MSAPRVLIVLACATFLGVAGDLLLRTAAWGINFTIWIALLAGTARALLRERSFDVRRGVDFWLGIATVFAFFGFAWRDSDFLRFWNFVAVVTALSIATLRVARTNLLTTRIREHAVGFVQFTASLLAGGGRLVLSDVRWQAITSDRDWRRIGGYVTGMAAALPLIFVFGGLFASADPVFESLVLRFVRWDVEAAISHFLVIGFLTWFAAGYLRQMVAPRDSVRVGDGAVAGRFGFPQIGIPIGAVTALFAGFVAIQASYLFGGEDVVQRVTGLGFAHYARRGFFELVTASALVVPLLLVGQWALDHDDNVAVRRFHALAFVLLSLVALVTASAWWRMRLYTNAYGLTSDRFYATAFIIWIGFLLGWFAVTILRRRPEQFAFGGLVSGFALLALLNAINPDAMIARVNLARTDVGKALDVSYLSRLSADATPTVVQAWERLDADQRCALKRVIEHRPNRGTDDWRSWTVAGHRARTAVRTVMIGSTCPPHRLTP